MYVLWYDEWVRDSSPVDDLTNLQRLSHYFYFKPRNLKTYLDECVLQKRNFTEGKNKLQLHRPIRELPSSNLFVKYFYSRFHIFHNVIGLVTVHSTLKHEKQKLRTCNVYLSER